MRFFLKFFGAVIAVLFLCSFAPQVTAESPPVYGEDGFSLEGLNFLKVEAVKQPIPKIKNGYADFEDDHIIVDMPRFYIADNLLRRENLPDYFSNHLTKGRIPSFSPYEIALLLDYLNENLLPLKDGVPVMGSYCIPTAADMISYVSHGEKYVPGSELPEDNPTNFQHMIADRYSPDLNLTEPGQFNALVTPTGTGDRGAYFNVWHENVGVHGLFQKQYYSTILENTSDNELGKALLNDQKVRTTLHKQHVRLKFMLYSDIKEYMQILKERDGKNEN